MNPRDPFVSGLPGDARGPRVAAPVDILALASLRAWAIGFAEERRPATVCRFDGSERIEALPEAVADVEACERIVRLVDWILADAALLARAAGVVRGVP